MWLVYVVIIFVSLVMMFGPMIERNRVNRLFKKWEKERQDGTGYQSGQDLDEWFAEIRREKQERMKK